MTVPKLRFKECDADWKKVALGKISKIFDGTHQTPDYVESGIKFVSVENINSPYASNKFITHEAYDKDFKNKPQLGDILMTRITAGEIGATALVTEDEPLAYYVSLALIRPKVEINTPFLNQYIASPFFKRELHKRIIHVAFPKKINLGDINECYVSLATSNHEQTKIASFLSAVDEKISQLSQKHELLNQYKQGMMQKLFSQQIRFKADDGSEFGKWEALTISDLVTSLDAGVSVNSEDIKPIKDEYSVLKTSCISSGYFDDNERKRVLSDKEIIRLKEPVLDNSILMSRMNTPALVGMNAYIKKAPKYTYLPDRLWQLKTNIDKVFTRWFAFYLGSKHGLNQIRELASGTSNSMKNITKTDVFNLELLVPSIEEQTKIANFLSSIDQKIEVVAQQIEHAKQWKKGLLQQMFV